MPSVASTSSYESFRRWVLKFGPAIARGLRRCRPRPSDRWHAAETTIFDLAGDGHVPEELTGRFLRIGTSPIGAPRKRRQPYDRTQFGWPKVRQPHRSRNRPARCRTPPRQFAARYSQLLQQARAPVRGSTTGRRSGAGPLDTYPSLKALTVAFSRPHFIPQCLVSARTRAGLVGSFSGRSYALAVPYKMPVD